MIKTIFEVRKMDCLAEEQLIRMQLAPLTDIKRMEFDIPARKLTVFHLKENAEIEKRLESLNLGTRKIITENTPEEVLAEPLSGERKILQGVLLINLSFFLIELISGLVYASMGLVADSLDMLADSLVYGLSLMAVGRSIARKKTIARIAGYFQIILAVAGFAEVIRRFIGIEIIPDYSAMIIVSALALGANVLSLFLLRKARNPEAHMQASMIFTSNDIIINAGVILAGILVYLTASNIPDLVVGTIVFLIVIRGAARILNLGKGEDKTIRTKE